MRSAAEQEIRNAVVARLRQLRPSARICHEVNCGPWGPVRIDVVCVDITEIIAVEIKSERDVLKRAEKQLAHMGLVAHHSILALHECHLVERETNPYAAHYGRLDGKHYRMALPDGLKRDGLIAWVYPEQQRGAEYDLGEGMWRHPEPRITLALPNTALHLLWRDELAWLCDLLQVPRGKKSNMSEMVRALWWHCTGAELTKGICAALRMRKFAEADAPVEDCSPARLAV